MKNAFQILKALTILIIITSSVSIFQFELTPENPETQLEFLSSLLCNIQTKKFISENKQKLIPYAAKYTWNTISKKLIATLMKECFEEHFQIENFEKLQKMKEDPFDNIIDYVFPDRIDLEAVFDGNYELDSEQNYMNVMYDYLNNKMVDLVPKREN